MSECIAIQWGAHEVKWGFHMHKPWSFLLFCCQLTNPRQLQICFLSFCSGILYNWSHIVHTFLYLALFIQNNVCEIHPCYLYQLFVPSYCSMFVPSYCSIVFRYMTIPTLLIIHLLINTQFVPVWGYECLKPNHTIPCVDICFHFSLLFLI